MHVEGYVRAVQQDLERIAAVGDDSTARAARVLAAALETSLPRRLQEALAEAALELSAQLDRGRVEVRIAGSDPELVYVEDADFKPADADDGDLSARVTLRLPETLKARLDAAAAAGGVSVNSWVVQALGRQLAQRPPGVTRHRLTGYGRG